MAIRRTVRGGGRARGRVAPAVLAVLLAAMAIVDVIDVGHVAAAGGCTGGYTQAELQAMLHDDPHGAGGIVGADYGRARLLPGGRVLWTFQDVFVGGSGNLATSSFMHNAALVQTGSCFRLLQGGGGRSWIGGGREVELSRWFWPLDSVIAADGGLAQFMVEMRNPNGTGAAAGARPVAVWIASIDLTDFRVRSLRLAPDWHDRPLFGFSIASDARFHYLYGNCFRQFADRGFAGFLHDITCGPLVFVARVPLGHPEVAPQYWTGFGWSRTRGAAVPIERRGTFANPMQVRHMDGLYISVSKVDDWWGTSVVVEFARSPRGPFTPVRSIRVGPVCRVCNTYFAHLLPWTAPDGSLLMSISNNAWNMRRDAFPHPERYRISVLSLPIVRAPVQPARR